MIRRITLAEARKRAIATLEKIEADRRISAGLEAATWRCCDYPEHDALEGELEALRGKLRQAVDALTRLAEGDSHSALVADDGRHCPACFSNLDHEQHDRDCWLTARLRDLEGSAEG